MKRLFDNPTLAYLRRHYRSGYPATGDRGKVGATMTGRDSLGRFTPGHKLAVKGWHGLVSKRFQGDSVAAREWLAQLGRYGYGLAYYHPQTGYVSWVKQCFRVHPGTPEQWLEEWRRRLEFSLADCGELKF